MMFPENLVPANFAYTATLPTAAARAAVPVSTAIANSKLENNLFDDGQYFRIDRTFYPSLARASTNH